MEVSFRKAKASDAPVICAFQLAMAWETEQFKLNPEICERGVKAVFEDAHRGQYYICEVDHHIVGSLLITSEWSDWRNGTVWWIQSVYLKPVVRGKKIFSRFYAHIKERAIEDKTVQGLRLYVDKRNEAAQKVYAKLDMNGEHYKVFEWMKINA